MTEQIFGYPPKTWQIQVTEKVLEGHDIIAIAGTGAVEETGGDIPWQC